MITKKAWLGIATMIGGTLGAGLFGVPYVFAHAGVLQGTLWTVFIGILVIILNLLQAEICLSMPPKLRLAGLMQKLLPRPRGFAGVFVSCMQLFIAVFAYISLVGAFTNTFLGAHSIHPAIIAAVYAAIIGTALYKGSEGIKKYEQLVVTTFLCVLLFLIIYGFSITTPTFFLLADKAQRFLPYGVLIYCLNSVSSIPVLEDMLDREKKDMPYVIIISGVICMSMVILRGWAVVGIGGLATTPDTISGLQAFLPSRIVKISGLIGILAIISPHLLIGEHLIDTLKQSFHLRRFDAWMTVTVLPLLAYLYIQSDFVSTIGFSGAVFTGLTCVFVGWMNIMLHLKHGKTQTHILPYNKFFSYLIIIVFMIGVIYECAKQLLL